ncbi:MAG: YcjF family protein, partial [Cyanobacteria bacterium]|nr:YcjF family protein [Cyanobacteria bacterium CG_2015-04_32_10]
LGDVDKNTEEIITELTTQLDIETKRARILILTVKINDFATDSLKNIAENLRKKYPQIPCLLVVTSLHELYPNLHSNHPEYPPNFPEIDRAFSEIKNTFSDLFDQATLIDFTLEEDGFIPMFYGLENLRDSLAELLPSAEAKTIHQLLDETVNSQLGNLYKNVARRYILAFSVMAVTLAAVPLPFATMPVLTALEVTMVGVLGRLYGQTINPSQAGGIISAIAGGFLAQVVGRELIKFIPGFGAVVAASWAGAYTWALGEGACAYFGDIVGGKKPNPEKIKAVMKDAFKDAKKQLKINQEN